MEENFLEALGAAQPRYATLPTAGADHELAAVELVAKLRNKPLLPWQRLVVRVATEKTAFGQYRYRTVVITVPRQSGKTVLVFNLDIARGIKYPHA
ncbi:hypothetical protein ACT3UD_18605, partial [Glutamicibacter sp. 287]